MRKGEGEKEEWEGWECGCGSGAESGNFRVRTLDPGHPTHSGVIHGKGKTEIKKVE